MAKITIEKLEEEIKKKRDLIDTLNWCKEFECSNLEEEILKKYIEIQNVAIVAKSINDDGHRLPSVTGERKYDSNDISKVITSNEPGINPELKNLAKKLQMHLKGKKKRWI